MRDSIAKPSRRTDGSPFAPLVGLLTALVCASFVVAPAGAAASRGAYTVVQCDPLNRLHADAVLQDAPPAYATRGGCGDPQSDYAIQLTSTGDAGNGRIALVRWSTPSQTLGIVGVRVEAKLRRDNGHVPRLWTADDQDNELGPIAAGHSGPVGFRHYGWRTAGHGRRRFIASLSCVKSKGCRRSKRAKAWLRDVHLRLADYSSPVLNADGGPLTGNGWLRGSQPLHASASDRGSGLLELVASANGTDFDQRDGSCDAIAGTRYAARLQPCGTQLILDTDPSTATGPFHDGRNALSVCAVDFAGNRTCDAHSVKVDNTPPTLAFADSQQPSDPELIRAPVSDATSGVASGQIFYRAGGETSWRGLDTELRSGALRARVDSSADPPGAYEFMVRASDLAGNVVQTTARRNGQPMVLSFPLKTGARLRGHLVPGAAPRATIGYGHPSKVSGRLADASGKPLVHQRIRVVEHFPEGALINRRVRTVKTDSDGLWGERLPAGPSRSITAAYEGTPRYLPDEAQVGALRVKTKASLHLSRRRVPEGRRVVFRGRVGHLAARVPAGGKLIELEVKEGPQWHTVRQPFYTRANGHYRLRYRFARFYTASIRYRFRVKVLRERGWPYKAPVHSHPKRLIVEAR